MVASQTFWQSYLAIKVTEVEKLTGEIAAMATVDCEELESSVEEVALEASLHVLRHTAVPHAGYLLRCLPPTDTIEYATRHDNAIMAACSDMVGADDPLGVHFTSWTWKQRNVASVLLDIDDAPTVDRQGRPLSGRQDIM